MRTDPSYSTARPGAPATPWWLTVGMTRHSLLLVAHITGVAAWLGANFVQIVLSPRFAKERPDIAAAWTRQQMWLGQRYYNVAGAAIAITGVLLVLDGDWSWSAGFVWVGIAVIILGGVLGVAAFTPLTQQRLTALESGDTAGAAAALSRILPLAALDSLLLITAALAMVHKWQA
jgi:hypothetical protein